MLKAANIIIILFLVAVFAAGCTTKIVQEGCTTASFPAPPAPQIIPEAPVADTQLLRTALSHLSNTAGTQDYSQAKHKLELFLIKYPESQWKIYVQNLIHTIEDIRILKNKTKLDKAALEKAHNEKTKLIKENEVLKAEIAKNRQENEQLKNDITLLKQLEIQLEKRGKMLK